MDKLIKTDKRTTIRVAVGIIENTEGQLLVAKRPAHWLGGGFWEFPGGKIEPNEDTETALKRELLEEVGITVKQCSPLIQLTYDYPERRVILHAWNVHTFSGVATGLEGQEISWCDPKSLNNLNMLPANRAIVVATQLPDIYLITPDCLNPYVFLQELRKTVLKRNIKMLQLHCKNLSSSDYIVLANKTADLCREMNVALILDYEAIKNVEIAADGIHLSSHLLPTIQERPLAKNKWVGASCHNEQDILLAEKIGVDFIVISPIHDSLQENALGWEGFQRLVGVANVPVFALGGMTVNDIPLAKKKGAHGIAGIRSLWDAK